MGFGQHGRCGFGCAKEGKGWFLILVFVVPEEKICWLVIVVVCLKMLSLPIETTLPFFYSAGMMSSLVGLVGFRKA